MLHQIPPIMINPVVHIEIAGQDGEKLEDFYSRLFGWSIARRIVGPGFPYGQIDTIAKSASVTGGIRHEPEGKAELVFYVEVDDLPAALAQAQELGATVRIPIITTPDLTFAMITDPEGNPVGMIQKKE